MDTISSELKVDSWKSDLSQGKSSERCKVLDFQKGGVTKTFKMDFWRGK